GRLPQNPFNACRSIFSAQPSTSYKTAWGIGLLPASGEPPAAALCRGPGPLLLTFHPVHNRVVGFNVRVEQSLTIVVAGRSLHRGDDDLGFGTVADRDGGPAFDALANRLGVAHKVVTGIAGHDAIALGVGAEGQAPSVQEDVIGGHVKVKVFPLAALP